MEFGKVEAHFLNTIGFQLPADDPRTLEKLRNSAGAKQRIGIGAPVWAAKAWLGSVYPTKTQPQDFLYHYSRAFNSIELNSTHYRIPDRPTIERWLEQTPPGFRFCPKFPQEISHKRPLSSHGPLLREFITNISGLGDRLGTSFLQLSPNFAPMDLPDLKSFLAQLPSGFQIAVEVRHPGFFERHQLSSALYDLLAHYGAHTVITDVSGRRDVLHTSLTSGKAMIRFIGNDLHPTDLARLADWSKRLAVWLRSGLRELEFFVHQPGDTNAPLGIRKFTELLNSAAGLDLPIWQQVQEAREEQMSWF